jgi:hypothetical protein
MNSGNWTKTVTVLLLGILCLAPAISTGAQVQTQKSITTGHSSKEVEVESGEVVLVQGNDLMVKMQDGTMRHFPNIPDSDRIMVDGKQLGIHDLKPGMKLQRTITTITTPQTVTTVQSVTGKVWNVMPPTSVILTLDNGENQAFKIPKDQKFTINGQQVDAFGLRKGMVVTATKIVEVPETLITRHRHVTGTMAAAAAPPAPAADVPILIAKAEPASAPGAAETAAAHENKLPKTASDLPLVGLVGLLLISASLSITLFRANLGH